MKTLMKENRRGIGSFVFAFAVGVCLAVSPADASAEYELRLVEDGAVDVSVHGSDPVRFEPEFKILHTDQHVTQRRFRLELPFHEVTAWQIRGQSTPVLNQFRVADVHKIRATGAEERDGVIHWSFPEHELFALEAEVHPSEDGKEPQVRFRFTAKEDGFFSVGYAGAPELVPTPPPATGWPPIPSAPTSPSATSLRSNPPQTPAKPRARFWCM